MIVVVGIVLVVIIAGVVLAVYPRTVTSKLPEDSITILPIGSFLMHPGYYSGPNGSGPAPTTSGQSFMVYSNMTDISVVGTFTSTRSVSVAIGLVGPWVQNTSGGIATPVISKIIWSSGTTTGKDISVSLPTPHNYANNDMYMILISMKTPLITRVTVTAPVVIDYSPS